MKETQYKIDKIIKIKSNIFVDKKSLDKNFVSKGSHKIENEGNKVAT